MEYQLSWLASLIVLVVALVIGSAAAILVRGNVARPLFAIVVSLVFVVAAMTAVVFGYSWMFTNMSRMGAQALALGALLTGVVYAMRAPR